MAETLEISQSDLQKMKIAELKKELKTRGLPTTGAKKELLQRLETHLNSGAAGEELIEAAGKEEVKEDTVENELDQVLEGDADEIALDESTETENKPASVPTETIVQAEEPSAKTAVVQPLSEADKLKNRAKKFGIVNEDLKKMTRAERFGIQLPSTGTATTGADMDKLKKRAERFGTVISSTLTKDEEKEKLKKRAERFGTVTSNNSTAPKGAEQEQILKRKERFGLITGPSNDNDAEAKKRKRAERFGLT